MKNMKVIARCDGGKAVCGKNYCCYECPDSKTCRSEIKCDAYAPAEESEECESRFFAEEHYYKIEVVEKRYATLYIKAEDEDDTRERAYQYEYDDNDFNEDETVLEVWDVEISKKEEMA